MARIFVVFFFIAISIIYCFDPENILSSPNPACGFQVQITVDTIQVKRVNNSPSCEIAFFNNQLSFLTKENHNLNKIDISQCNITKTTFSGAQTPNIIMLNVSHNGYTNADSFVTIFENLNRLTGFDVSYNQIDSIPREAFKYADNLKTLNLTNNKLTEFTYSIFPTAIRPVDVLLASNEFKFFDASCLIEKCELNTPATDSEDYYMNLPNLLKQIGENLSNLNLFGNHIEIVTNSTGFERLGTLEKLKMSRCDIISIEADSFPEKNVLTDLDLSFNSLSVFDVRRMHHLKTLNLEYNKIIRIDEISFAKFHSLKTLVISNNFFDCKSVDKFLVDWKDRKDTTIIYTHRYHLVNNHEGYECRNETSDVRGSKDGMNTSVEAQMTGSNYDTSSLDRKYIFGDFHFYAGVISSAIGCCIIFLSGWYIYKFSNGRNKKDFDVQEFPDLPTLDEDYQDIGTYEPTTYSRSFVGEYYGGEGGAVPKPTAVYAMANRNRAI